MKLFCVLRNTFYSYVAIGVAVMMAGVFLGGGAARAASTQDLERVLTDRLLQLQQQINQYRGEINDLRSKKVTLGHQIALSNLEIDRVQSQIEATNIAIQQSDSAINTFSQKIADYQKKLDSERGVLAHFLRLFNQNDQESLAEVVLAEDNFHDFFTRYQELSAMQSRMLKSVESIQDLKSSVQSQRTQAEQERESSLQLKALQQIEQASLQKKIAVKQQLISQGEVRASLLNDWQKAAEQAIEEVKKNLYVLQGLGGSLSLQDAYNRASKVANKVGIRPALLMAVLKKESDWGNNIGGGNWRRDMNPRDYAAFKKVTSELGLNPDTMPVSAKPSYGWGGAMGPAQFLPTTWLAYKDRIAVITGHNPPSPWDLDDAFAAAGIKLSAGGANQKTSNAEWKAVQMYFAGSNWNKPQYSFYGDSVMELATVIQQHIGDH